MSVLFLFALGQLERFSRRMLNEYSDENQMRGKVEFQKMPLYRHERQLAHLVMFCLEQLGRRSRFADLVHYIEQNELIDADVPLEIVYIPRYPGKADNIYERATGWGCHFAALSEWIEWDEQDHLKVVGHYGDDGMGPSYQLKDKIQDGKLSTEKFDLWNEKFLSMAGLQDFSRR